jgi:hypothetical protein
LPLKTSPIELLQISDIPLDISALFSHSVVVLGRINKMASKKKLLEE